MNQKQPQQQGQKRILAVDDEPDLTKFYSLALEYLVLESSNNYKIHERLKGTDPQIIAFDSQNPSRAYCGTFGDGLLKTDDCGQTWNRIGKDAISSQNITSVSVSHLNRENIFNRVYVGTEPSALYTSNDGGDSWEKMEALNIMELSSKAVDCGILKSNREIDKCGMFPTSKTVFIMLTLVILCFSCGMLLSKNNVYGQEGSRAMTFNNHLGNSSAKFAVQVVQSGEREPNSQFCNAEPNSSCEITVNPYYQYLVLVGIPADNSKHFLDKHGVSGFCTVTLSQVSGEYIINKLCP
jgi:hypothetical protein